MLDRYWYGSVDRISPEAPVPVVRITREEERNGGAANVAYNVLTLGAQASLLTVVGDDEASHKLEALVAKTGIRTHFGRDADLKTTVKLRVIGRQQDAFLVLGVQHLRPLNLRTVADAIEMHESTVSRVTSNKYMATPRGIYELKYFFTTAIASSEEQGDAHSAEAVRHRIKELIGQETDKVLSDDTIVQRLQAMGIEIARRTVAKYREELGIPSSVQRRRERKVSLRMGR